MVEYRIEKVTIPMEANQLQNNYGVDGWDLISIVEYGEQLWYHFKRE